MEEKGDLKTNESYASALTKYQEMYGLNVTGTLTPETMTSMKHPRCGVSDFSNSIHHDKMDQRWAITDLTWNFYMGDKDDVRATEAAFEVWQKHSTLTFKRVFRNPNILISYKSLQHTYTADSNRICTGAFDGTGAVLAHAFFPKYELSTQVEIHIDSDEIWFKDLTPPPKNMTSLLHMLIHEIGHSLGIHHSDVEESVMYAWYSVPKTNFGDLHITDVLSIQNLYGKPTEKKDEPAYSPRPTHTGTFKPTIDASDKNSYDIKQNISICGHVRGKYHFLVVDKRMLIFYKKWVWAMNLMRRRLTPAQLITNWLPFLDGKGEELDAIYQRPNGEVVLFMSNVAYFVHVPSLSLSKMMYYSEFINSLSDSKIHGAINTYRGKTYIFYNNLYFMEIDECAFKPIRYGRIADEFPRVPPHGISAFRYIDGNLYFMQKKNKLSYVFNEFMGKLLRTETLNHNLFGIDCSAETLFEQIKNLLGNLTKIKYMFPDNTDDYEDENNAE